MRIGEMSLISDDVNVTLFRHLDSFGSAISATIHLTKETKATSTKETACNDNQMS